MTDEDYEKLHPYLSGFTQFYVDLYTNRPDEENRKRLIKLEKLLHEQLEAIEKAKEGKQ